MKTLVRGYFTEAKWFHEGYVPTMEEYMPTAVLTCGYSMLSTTSFVGLGEIATKDAFDWVSSVPKIVIAASMICRLMDDIVSHKFEQKRGHVASAVECYMKQHEGASEKKAVAEFQEQVGNAWKDINEEFLRPTAVPMLLLTRVLNLARVIDVLYKDEDGYVHAQIMMKDLVTSLLINSVPI
ncbi:hypothetical protein F0562_010174 [Nyssa sinensis]|uniref:Terpene synthase metal-binding domain-containing protein n=1 Tax=Nyssa sinensis TaxID=561372 RepID=A0A5J5A2V6_9ASTE|nr:hypothetical protein F0562_010174 [Nyssa sinensis]